MEFRILGTVGVLDDGVEIAPGGALGRAFLAMLLMRANEQVPLDTLADALWPGHPVDRAEQRLQVHASRLRTLMGDATRLVFDQSGYRLRVEPGELDSDRFEGLAAEAENALATDPSRCAALAREGLDLWRGAAYAGLDVPPLRADSQRLTGLQESLTELLYDARLTTDRPAGLVSELSDLVRRHPVRERFTAQLMTALYLSGRQAEALEAYRSTRTHLIDELGVEPGPELRDLEATILAGESMTGPATSSAPVPRMLPFRPSRLVGRDEEFARLDELFDGDAQSSLVVLTGTAGVGKTATALHWAHSAADDYPDGQLYVDLRGYGPDEPVDPGDALSGFLAALEPSSGLPADGRGARFRSLVADRRMLVILDNAHSSDQVRPLLPGNPDCAVLVTSRDSLPGLGAREGAVRIDLGVLSSDDAVGLLADMLGPRSQPDVESLRTLANQCARLPLGLRVAAELGRARPLASVADLVEELADEGDRLDVLDLPDDRTSALRPVFGASYQHLGAGAATLFRRTGLHPGHDADVFALAALCGESVRTTRRHLDELLRANLIEEREARRYRSHDLLRAYARELAESIDETATREAAQHRLLDHYLAAAKAAVDVWAPYDRDRRPDVTADESIDLPGLESEATALAWLDGDYGNLVSAAQIADRLDHYDYVRKLPVLLWRYVESTGRAAQALRLYDVTLAAARRRHDRKAEGDALRLMALANFSLGETDQCRRNYELALVIHEERGEHVAVSTVHNGLAGVHFVEFRPGEATRELELSLAASKRAGHENSLESVHVNLGLVQHQLGRLDQAEEHATRSLELAEASGDRPVIAEALVLLAALLRDKGDPVGSLAALERAQVFVRDSGVRAKVADILCEMARAHRELGALEKSRRCDEEALEAATTITDHELMARARNGLGLVQRQLGNPLDAARHHRAALDLAREHSMLFDEAQSLTFLGDALSDAGRVEDGVEAWRAADDLYRKVDVEIPEAERVRSRLEQGAPPLPGATQG
ncbi:AfsR/SARP family transcriptional regulator [Nocardioides sp. Soil796]|uniref:AfsR/SARP family transcriptional regulator n=1 Tax=Nocardioides sp. Soil796 TaxID=1736412 RepID=UPI000709EEE6|nr:BTAD domain-containing putative transcriptional regulator [Nocardioides sp. Soil796]KRF15818.1 hypothetical protein ASH02_04090 [Nocardioides sp. Soil796]